MFIGHYGPALAIKRQVPKIPLWLLFVAVQWVDVLFFVFVLLGIEHARLVSGFTASNSYDLYFMPYTHSLLGALGWSVAFAALALGLRGAPRGWAALGLGLGVVSHFFLDVPMHTADLSLYPTSSVKFGLGLWNWRLLACGVETATFVAGLLWLGWGANRRYRSLAGVGIGLIWLAPWMPMPGSVGIWALQALASYAVFAVFAGWVEKAQR